MIDQMNPLIPALYDIVWSGFAVVGLVLAVTAFVSISRAAKRLSVTQALIWVPLVIFLPIIGSVMWLAIGRRSVMVNAPTGAR